jgi:hypothetical protein
MSVPGVGSRAADKLQEQAITDQRAKMEDDGEADVIEGARKQKSDVEDIQDSQNADDENYGSEDEAGKLERGAFQPHAYPHINFPENVGSSPKGKSTAANGNANKREVVHAFGRGGAGRRQSTSGPSITSEAAELARAEAASWAQMSPLMAATLGPLSVMLGIPTLTQRWRGQLLDPPVLESGVSNFVALPDPTLNLVLAGVSLFCEIAGNGLLILRFSNFHTKITTWVSYAFWIAKIVIGLTNYIQFGINYPQTDDIIYLEGFWVHSQKVWLTSRLAFVVWESPSSFSSSLPSTLPSSTVKATKVLPSLPC